MRKITNRNAVSEIIGTVLLLSITVTLFSVITVVIFSFPLVNNPPYNDIVISTDGDNLIFLNAGGEGLSLDTKIELFVDGEEKENYTIDNFLSQELKQDGLWGYTEQFNITCPMLRGKDVTVNIIDVTTNSLISNTNLNAVYPLLTRVNMIYPFYQYSVPLTISAESSGATPDNITLWYQHLWFWEDMFENDDMYVSSYNNMSFNYGDFVIVNRSGSGIIDYVDQLSDEDGCSDIGSHSDFDAQTVGPDTIFDSLLEQDTVGSYETVLINNQSFEGYWPPSGWSESGYTNWNKENNKVYRGYWSADFDGYGYGEYGYLYSPYLDCSDASSIYLSFYFNEDVSQDNEFELYLKDNYGNWDNIEDLGYSPYGWNHYTIQIVDSQYFNSNFQIAWYARDVESEEHIYLDYVYVSKESGIPNFELDLEMQWTDVVFSKPIENLCIYANNVNTEDLKVEIWNSSILDWDELIESISVGWNNISVSDWLISDTLTIRYKDGSNVSDSDRGSWEIDCAYLYLVDPDNDYYYQGNITSINITKPIGSTWNKFYAIVNETDNSKFSILDEDNQVLVDELDGNGNSISFITDDTIKLYGSFNGEVKLESWNVSVDISDWMIFETDDNEPWFWSFDFPKGEGIYNFYCIAKREGWYDENIPSIYDTQCYYSYPGG